MVLKWKIFPDESFKYKWSSPYGTTKYEQHIHVYRPCLSVLILILSVHLYTATIPFGLALLQYARFGSRGRATGRIGME
jgi:hypothetical protein